MTGTEIIAKVRALNLAVGSYIVFGSCPLAAAGIRESEDIDLLVSNDCFETLKTNGWQLLHKGAGNDPVIFEDLEAYQKWEIGTYIANLEELLRTADYYEGIPFAALKEVRKWKITSDREKDKQDIKLIDAFVATKS